MSKKTTSHEIAEEPSAPAPQPPVQASGIPVHCAFHELRPAASLQPHPDNAKLHPAKQLDRYEQIVLGNGWRRPIVLSDLTGRIVKGHGAWLMAKRRDWLVPIEIQHYDTSTEERRDLLADNRLAELAETDDEKLAALLSSLDAGDLALTGFDPADLAQLLADSTEPEAEFPITARLHESYDYVLIFCDNEPDFVFLQTLCGIAQERILQENRHRPRPRHSLPALHRSHSVKIIIPSMSRAATMTTHRLLPSASRLRP